MSTRFFQPDACGTAVLVEDLDACHFENAPEMKWLLA
jgi:hypothetical protein